MTAIPVDRHAAFAGVGKPGRRKAIPVVLRTKLLVFAVSSYLVLIIFLTMVHDSGTPLAAWVWPPLWLLVDLLLGGPSHAAAGRQLIRIPLLASLIVVAAISALSVFAPAQVVVDGFLTPFIVGLLSLTAMAAGLRWVLFRLRPRRRLRVITMAEPVWPDTHPHGEGKPVSTWTLFVSGAILADPEAFTAAVVKAADYHEVEYVELDALPGGDALRRISWELRRRDVSVELPLYSLGIDPQRLQSYGTVRGCGISLSPARPGTRTRIVKRLLDITASAVLLIIFSPIFLIVTVVIKTTMPGPTLFRQERIGKDGEPFHILKFRSMIVNADAQLQQLLREQGRDDVPLFKVERDPRITPVGSFLRRSSIDELPQLLNVLHGTMSLVGPRPQRAGEVALYTGVDSQRLGVLPGMTGLWQVSGRSGLSWEAAREYDLYYAHNWSLRNDIAILARTFRAVIQAAGAR